MSQNSIVKASEPLLNYLLKLIHQFESNAFVAYDDTRVQLNLLLLDVEKNLESNPVIHEKIKTVKYILAALIDHVLTFSKWDGAAKWCENLFEMKFFNTAIAGDKFYEIIQNEGMNDPELAEILFLCLNFWAPFYTRSDIPIVDLKQRLYYLIPERLPNDDREISKRVDKMVTQNEKLRSPALGFWIFAIIISVCTAIYIQASIWIWEDAVKIITDISEKLMNRGC